MSTPEELSRTREEWINEPTVDKGLSESALKAINENTNLDQINDDQLLKALHYAILKLISEEKQQIRPAKKVLNAGLTPVLNARRDKLALMSVKEAQSANAEELRKHLGLVANEAKKVRNVTVAIEKVLRRDADGEVMGKHKVSKLPRREKSEVAVEDSGEQESEEDESEKDGSEEE